MIVLHLRDGQRRHLPTATRFALSSSEAGKPPLHLISCFDPNDRPVEQFWLDDVVAILVAQPRAGTVSVPGDQS